MTKIRRLDNKLSKYQISQEERNQLAQAFVGVHPLKYDTHVAEMQPSTESANPKPRRQPGTREICKSTFVVSDSYTPVGALHSLSFHRTDNRKELARLKSGKMVKQASIDLHGFRLEQAAEQLFVALEEWLKRGYRVVQIVHGKGARARSGYSVIKTNIPHWLQSIPQVLAYTSCRDADGGVGAVMVLLKRKRVQNKS